MVWKIMLVEKYVLRSDVILLFCGNSILWMFFVIEV